MFHASNISAKNYVRHLKLKCLQAGSKITLTPSRHQMHSKTEMSYAVI